MTFQSKKNVDKCLRRIGYKVGRPLKIMEDIGFKMIFNPIFACFKNSFTINSINVRKGVLLADFK
jgi:hypothetical protein